MSACCDPAGAVPPALLQAWSDRALVPFVGPGALGPDAGGVPASAPELAAALAAGAPVPHKLRNRLTQAAQYIESFRHRRTLVSLLRQAFAVPPRPGALHAALAALAPPLIVDLWYDASLRAALAAALPAHAWGEVQGVSRGEHPGCWTLAWDAGGAQLSGPDPGWGTLLYKPQGGIAPAANFVVSDSDFVEVLTEIDIQTPIPAEVQRRRTGLPFLFLGCRFDDQLARTWARQVAKRSAGSHWAILPETPTRMEARFLEELRIERVPLALPDFLDAVAHARVAQPGTG